MGERNPVKALYVFGNFPVISCGEDKANWSVPDKIWSRKTFWKRKERPKERIIF